MTTTTTAAATSITNSVTLNNSYQHRRLLVSYFTFMLVVAASTHVESLTPDGAHWLHAGSPFIATHTTPTRNVSKRGTRLQTDPYGMPSYGKLEDDAFIPVQEDPSRAVADFGKAGKSFFQELEERKQAVEAARRNVQRRPSIFDSFQSTSAAEASFQKPGSPPRRSSAQPQPTARPRPSIFDTFQTTSAAEASFGQVSSTQHPHSHSQPQKQTQAQAQGPPMEAEAETFMPQGPRPDDRIHFHRYSAEKSFHRPSTFEEDRRRAAEVAFGRKSPSTSFNTQRAANAGFRHGSNGSFYNQQPQSAPPQESYREFERQEYTRQQEDWQGPSKAGMSPQEKEFFFAVRPTVGGNSFGQTLPGFIQENPFEFFSARKTTSFRNRPLAPNFY